MHSKQQIKLYTWIAGIAFVCFDLAVAAFAFDRAEQTACTTTAPTLTLEQTSIATAIIAPAVLMLRQAEERS